MTNTLVHSTTPIMIVVSVFLAAFVVIMHRTNIRRILDGNENRFYFGKKKAPAEAAPVSRLDKLDDDLVDKN